MTGQGGATTSGEQAEAIVKAFRYLLRRQHVGSRRGELDGKGNPIQSLSYVGGGLCVLLSQGKAGLDGTARSANKRTASQSDSASRDALADAGTVSDGTRWTTSPGISSAS